jgi:hypothetical protein
MIIFDAIICHVPITVLIFGSNSENPTPFLGIFNIYEKIQVTIFFLQEVVLSGLYIHETVKIMRLRNINGNSSNTKMMRHLIGTNILIIILDVTIVTLEFCNLYNVQTAYKGAAYSVKLKLEFNILNRLVEIVSPRNNAQNEYSSERIGATHLETIRGSARDKKDRGGHKAYIYTGDAGDLDSPDLVGANKSVIKTTEIVITSEGDSTPRNRAASSSRSDMTGESNTPTEAYANQETCRRSSSSEKHFASAGF